MGGALSVEHAGPLDAPVLAALHAACFDRAWDTDTMATFIASAETMCLIGLSADTPATPSGLLVARRAADEAEILTIGVIPRLRRHGLARLLLCQAMAGLSAMGARRLFLEVAVENAAAQALYRSLGAQTAGRRQGYYETGSDAAILCLSLPEPARR